jgi:indolepyruvate ferredoxin oxidoreductase beta subunit
VTTFNVYLTGVGGQGIGLLSEIILRAADHAGLVVKSVDTHGLAQRGGIVVSQIRMGDTVFSPLIPAGAADVVIALERHEALRASSTVLKIGGRLIYYNTVWQPLSVRLNDVQAVTEDDIRELASARKINVVSVFQADLPDIRMQNMVVLAEINRHRLIPDIELKAYRSAMTDLMTGTTLESNQALFDARLKA